MTTIYLKETFSLPRRDSALHLTLPKEHKVVNLLPSLRRAILILEYGFPALQFRTMHSTVCFWVQVGGVLDLIVGV